MTKASDLINLCEYYRGYSSNFFAHKTNLTRKGYRPVKRMGLNGRITQYIHPTTGHTVTLYHRGNSNNITHVENNGYKVRNTE